MTPFLKWLWGSALWPLPIAWVVMLFCLFIPEAVVHKADSWKAAAAWVGIIGPAYAWLIWYRHRQDHKPRRNEVPPYSTLPVPPRRNPTHPPE